MLTNEVDRSIAMDPIPAWLAKMLPIEWLGQTAASLRWITSVFAYRISFIGDYLQLSAAPAWLIANIAVALLRRRQLR